MNLQETMNKIKEMEKRESELKEDLAFLRKEREDVTTRLYLCAIFDESLIQVISELLSINEEENYVPFMYKSYSSIFTNGAYSVENDCIGIAKDEYLPMFNQIDIIQKLFEKKYGYDMICVNTKLLEEEKEEVESSVKKYNLQEDYSKKVFTFDFLLNEIGLSASTYPVIICKSNFNEYSYIQDYIRYVFDLQVQNSAMRINFEEMQKAKNDFLKLEKGKTKIKKI